jgi:hypothetical protein
VNYRVLKGTTSHVIARGYVLNKLLVAKIADEVDSIN